MTDQRRRLTPVTLEKLRPRTHVGDADCPGLRAKRGRTSRITFYMMYRRPSGRGNKLTIGTWDGQGQEDAEPTLGGPCTIAQARWLVIQAKRDLARGIDPGVGKREAKAERRVKSGETFDVVGREFILRHSKPKTKRWRGTAASLGFQVDKKTDELLAEVRKDSLADRWRDRPVSSLTKRELLQALDERVDAGHPYAANARFALLRKFCNWCVERGVLDRTPLVGVKRPHESKSRDRVLTPLELRALWRACDTQGPFGTLTKLLLLTAQRRDEIRWLTWTELSPDGASLILARVRTKNNTAHVVPLSKVAQGVVQGLPRIAAGDRESRYVLTLNGRAPLKGLSKAKKRLDAAMKVALAELDPRAEWSPWRLHDCRRTASTLLAELGCPQEHVEALLNHRNGKTGGLAGIYNRYSYDLEKRRCVQVLADKLMAIIEPPPATP